MDLDSPRTPTDGVMPDSKRAPSPLSMIGPLDGSLESLGPCGEYSQSALSSELSSTVIDSDNPFTESNGSPLQFRAEYSQEFGGSPLRNMGQPSQNTAFSDEPKGISLPAGSWKLPRCLSRSSSQVATESSPLRWSFSNVDRRLLDPNALSLSLPKGLLSLPRGRSESAVFYGGLETPPDSDRSTPGTGKLQATSAPILCPPHPALASPPAPGPTSPVSGNLSGPHSGPISGSGSSTEGSVLSRAHRVLSKDHLRRLTASDSGTLDPYMT